MIAPIDLDLAHQILAACPLDARKSVEAMAQQFGVERRRYGAVLDGLYDEGLLELDLDAGAFVATELGRGVLA